MNRPEIVSVGVVWDSERPSLEHIMDVFATVGTSLRLSDVFHSVVDSRWGASTVHNLVGVVTYYGKHYSTFFFHTKLKVCIEITPFTLRLSPISKSRRITWKLIFRAFISCTKLFFKYHFVLTRNLGYVALNFRILFVIFWYDFRYGSTLTTRPWRRLVHVGSKWWRNAEGADINRCFCCTQLPVGLQWTRKTPRKRWLLSRTEMGWRHPRRIMFDDRSPPARKNHPSTAQPDVPSRPIQTAPLTLTRSVGFTAIIRIWPIYRIIYLGIRWVSTINEYNRAVREIARKIFNSKITIPLK